MNDRTFKSEAFTDANVQMRPTPISNLRPSRVSPLDISWYFSCPDFFSGVFVHKYGRVTIRLGESFEREAKSSSSAPKSTPDFGELMAEWILSEYTNDYTIDESCRSQIAGFLIRRPSILNILSEAYDRVSREFGPNPRIILTLESDSIEGYNILFANIETTLAAREALPRLQVFEENWFNKKLGICAGQLTFSLEYK